MKSKTFLSLFVLLGFFLSTSLAIASAPLIIALPATGVDRVNATLNGMVNPNGESTTVSFEYSTSSDLDGIEAPAPDTISAIESPVTGAAYVNVSANLSTLTPGTRYYFRVVAANASGTVKGEILSFSTDPVAVVTTGSAGTVTTTTATLNGTVDAQNDSTTVTFEYGLTDSYGSTVTADQSPVTGAVDTPVSKALSGLTPDTTYHFRVKGTNSFGTVNGDDMTFFTSAQAAPTVTTDYAEYSLVPNTATLKGTVNANNGDTTVTFEYGLTAAYGTTVTADESPVTGTADIAVSKTIAGLTADTTYHYRVVGVNGIGTANGADMTFYNTVVPYARTDAASNIGNTTAILNGTVNPKRFENSNDTTVSFEYGLTAAYGTTVTAVQSPLSGEVSQAVNVNLSGLTANTTYHYRVTATSPFGTGTSADMTFSTTTLPDVDTLTASPVGTTTATLNGTVNSHNDSAAVIFEYGLTDSYGTTVTADQSPVTSSSDTTVSKAITGLTISTVYHYRVVATNSSGTSNGADQTFTTGVSPPSVTTDAATSVGNTTVTLNGTVNANGRDTTVNFEWGATTSYGRSDAASPNIVSGSANTAVSANLTGLTPGTVYHYRAVGQNLGGTVYGADMTFESTEPPIVTTSVPSPVTTTTATLNGIVNAGNQSTTVTFEYGNTVAYGTIVTADQSPVGGSADTAVSKAITGLTPATTYHYRVVGQNASGTSNGADMTFNTSIGAPIATTDAATSVNGQGAVVNGTVNANNESTTVTFEYGTTVAYGTVVTADQSPVIGSADTAVNFTLNGLTNTTTYHYRVVATNGSGTTNGADMTFTTTSKPIAVTKAATNILFNSATLNGTVNNNNTITSTSITFDYGTTVAYGTSVAATPSSTSGSVDTDANTDLTGLMPNTLYHYRVRAQSAFGTTNGIDMTFTTPVSPEATTNAATSVAATTATLNGTVNAQNADAAITFEYGPDTNYGHIVIGTPSPVTGNTPTTVSGALNTLIPSTTYHYRVVASNANGTVNGADMTFTTSGSAPIATTDAASSITAATAILNGTVNPNNDATIVTFEYGTTTGYGNTVTADQSPLAAGPSNESVSKDISGLATGVTYHYRVVAQNGTGTTNGADMTFTAGSIAPMATTETASGISAIGVTLNGTVNANNNSTTVTFEYGQTVSYGATVTAAQSPVSGDSDTTVSGATNTLIGNTTYHYRVVAQNGVGTTNGADMTFTTNVPNSPTVTTANVTDVTDLTATCGGNVTDEGDTSVTARGVCWSTSPNPTIADGTTLDGTGGGAYTSSITGLAELTTYYVRAYATNSYDTSYGGQETFTTADPIPTLTEWGMIILVLFLGIYSVYYIRRNSNSLFAG